MKTNNALKKVLLHRTEELPYGFNDRVMRQIMLEAERKGRASYYRALGLVALVSMLLIAGLIYVLNTYFGINVLDLFAGLRMPSLETIPVVNDQTRAIIAFSIYIGVLMLFLLGMDHLFRQRFGQRKKG
jgi:hypothetical protein